MAKSLSPLRYPGGKSKIYEKVKTLIVTNALGDRTYVEPFAGGFGIGIGLLCDGTVQTAILNDFDVHIYHFWYAILHHTEELVRMIADTPITLEERDKQRNVYKDEASDILADGFATLFLNRVNFSGVFNGGPIGGLSQQGEYKIDCRFNKDDIIKRIEQIAMLRDRIALYNYDASDLITIHLRDRIATLFFNIDPPYVKKGYRLYKNYFKEEDHRSLERVITDYLGGTQWIATYDDCNLVREIYGNYHMVEYEIQHNVGASLHGQEVVITNIPQAAFIW